MLNIQKIKVGVFFGGPSREREISFKGGKTAYENLDKTIFDPILIFVDSLGNFIQVEKEILYENEIRDFYPSRNLNRGYSVYIESLGNLNETQLYKLIYKIGKQVKPTELSDLMDFAFVIMHGPQAEDGAIQGMLEWLNIPYMGPGILGSAVGINKYFQNQLIAHSNGQIKNTLKINADEWKNGNKKKIYTDTLQQIGFPLVVKAPHQGSSIGVAIVKKKSFEEFSRAVGQCLFETQVFKKDWDKQTERQKRNFAQRLGNLDEGIGYPVVIDGNVFYHPADLVSQLDLFLHHNDSALIESVHAEDFVVVESFIEGREFSCGVVQDPNGKAIALPPTEIYSETGTFDFKSKYISGTTKKRIPIDTTLDNLHKLHKDITQLFDDLGMNSVARIDGFLTDDDRILFHDPNTIPGMSPASLIFKQLSEVGLSITHSLSYLIRQSLRERIRSGKNTFKFRSLLSKVDKLIQYSQKADKKTVVVMFEESNDQYTAAKTMYNKTAASAKYRPEAVLLTNTGRLVRLPVNLMMKDQVADVVQQIDLAKHPFLEECIANAKELTVKYLGQEFDSAVRDLTEVDLLSLGSLLYNVQTGELTEL